MIQLENISKNYGDNAALLPLSLAFAEGKTTALIGPSGCGKSTLLRLLMGLIKPSSGQVVFNGAPVPDWIQTRREMGYVVQDGGLFPHLTAQRNVGLMARHLKKPESQIQSKINELCELTRFPKDGLQRFPAELSGGQKQRLSLMRALMLEPQILLLDEPLGALDPMVRVQLQADLKEIFQRLKQTVIFVTHDLAEAGFLSDEIVLMNEGAIVQKGSLKDLQEKPASEFVTKFLSAQRSLVAL
ncbi:MAG TPA: ATP-binding cassette domain-containing protein [Fimbriimonadaceae bacterium]|jgi:osmoprotectant transport system ATP-binding protein